jgi:ABC-2 type transport system ATP-binding protein
MVVARPQAAPTATPAERPIRDALGAAPAIIIDALTKHYATVNAVDGISLTVAKGEIFSLLGHNGAGKTTTIKILTGRARPTSGRAQVLGLDVATERDRIKPLINLVAEEQNLYERMTGRENLAFFARLYGSPASVVDELLEAVGLTVAAKRRVKTYSNGMKQRLLVARALVNSPKVLFLDEPTAGLDPISARQVRELVRSLSSKGTTVFLTTHYMEEADELSDHVAFMSSGKIVALDTPRELKLRFGNRSARVLLRSRAEATVQLADPADASQLQQWMRNDEVLTIHSQEGTLEDVFIALAGRAL